MAKKIIINKTNKKADLSILAERWPSGVVARSSVKDFTGGLLSGRYCANLDAAGKGPPSIRVNGRNVAYPVKSFIRWLEERSEVLKKD